MFKWLTHRSFLFNLIAAIIIVALIGFAFFASLGSLTHHGETIKVPDLIGKNISNVKKLLSNENFIVVVKDSAYVDSLPPLSVVDQAPRGNKIVKPGRTIYLTLNKAEIPSTIMPDLIDFTFRSALMTLQNQKLKLGDTLYKPDIAEDAVLAQMYNNKPIKPGTKIPEGSHITLVLGNGLGNAANSVPSLVGLTYLQASELISARGLNPGVVLTKGDITDTANAYVYRQRPSVKDEEGRKNRIRAGAVVDLWISDKNPYDTTNFILDSLPQ